MTLNQLKYFCETCRCHSITAAANQLFVTQPAISLAIRELEAEFGITLFTRFNNRLTLTEDGALFYKKADYILQYCKDMQFELNGSRIQQNPIHVGIPPVLSSFFFPGLIDAYRSKYPDALVSLEEYGSVRACDLVLEDKLDLALVNMEMYNIDQLNSHVLIHDQLVFCVSKLLIWIIRMLFCLIKILYRMPFYAPALISEMSIRILSCREISSIP